MPAHLRRQEQRGSGAEFGKRYAVYATRTPALFPRFFGQAAQGGDQKAGMIYLRRSKANAAKDNQYRQQDMSNDRNCRPLIAASRKYPHHSSCEVELDADVSRLFALLDDVRRLSAHMEKPSLMMAGATMHVETDVFEGKAVGSLLRMTGPAWNEPGG